MKLMKGFTLIETMLVMVIISAFLIIGIRYAEQRNEALKIDRASLQMQQILNAGLSYYVGNGSWPVTSGAPAVNVATNTNLVPDYLPSTIISPWGVPYLVSATDSLFTVSLTLPPSARPGLTAAQAQIIAGTLPLSSATPGGVVTGSVNLPGGTLSNMGNVSYAGVFRNGACVPVPDCSAASGGTVFTPQVEVAPAAVSGLSDGNITNGYPVISFTARATTATLNSPPSCSNSTNLSTGCYDNVWGGALLPSGTYWRVCLDVITSKGAVTWNASTGQYAQIVVFTRCDVSTGKQGSSFNVWAP